MIKSKSMFRWLIVMLLWLQYDAAVYAAVRPMPIVSFRGGSTYPDSNQVPYNNNDQPQDVYNPNNPQVGEQEDFYNPAQQQQQPQEAFLNPQQQQQPQEAFLNPQQQQQPQEDFFNPPQEEAFQDRIDTWKQKQRQEQQSLLEQAEELKKKGVSIKYTNPLMVQLSRGTQMSIFFLFTWRNIHFYEIADDYFRKKGSVVSRFVTLCGLLSIFLLNIFGTVVSSMASTLSHAQKKRLKAILNLDKVIEIYFIISSVFQLTFFSHVNEKREILLASILHSVIFIGMAQTHTSVNWSDKKLEAPTVPQNEDGDYYYGEQNYNNFQTD